MKYLLIIVLIFYSLQATAYTQKQYMMDRKKFMPTQKIVPRDQICIVEISQDGATAQCYNPTVKVFKLGDTYFAAHTIFMVLFRDDATVVFFRTSLWPRMIPDRRAITDFIQEKK